jgi:HEAT repeat protein
MHTWNSQKIVSARFALVVLVVTCLVLPVSSWAQNASDAAVSVQIQKLKAKDPNVQRAAIREIALMGPDAVPSLVEVLTKDSDTGARLAAALAIERIGRGAKVAVPDLIHVLTNDADPTLRVTAANVLGGIGPEAKAAIPVLIQIFSKDTDVMMREAAAQNLGNILGDFESEEAKAAIPFLISSLTKGNSLNTMRSTAASALEHMGDAARDAQRIEMIDPLAQAAQALEASGFTNQAKQVRVELAILRAIQPPWYKSLYAKISSHPRTVGIATAYPILVLVCLALLWWSPQSLSRINGISFLSKKVKLPDWAFGVEASLAHVILVGFFRYHPRVLDAWVSECIPTVRDQFSEIPTVAQRKVHVEVPVELDRKVISALKSEHLNKVFSQKRTRLLIRGEGGSGKTSLACQIAQWAMADAPAIRPCKHRMLPIMIEQDLNLEVAKDKVVLIEVIRGQLKNLTGQDDAPDQELVLQLLKRKRVLLIVDSFSELSEATRNKIRPVDPEFPANNLIVTSRLEESLDEVAKTTLHPQRVQGNRLASFMEAYLRECGKRELFVDAEFFEACKRLSEMVGSRDVTVLLAKLYAEQLITSKEKPEDSCALPENIPDLMLQYLNQLNRKVVGMDDSAVRAAAKIIAWECLRHTFQPTPAKMDVVLEALGGDEPESKIKYLEKKLQLIQVLGVARSQVKFALDPLAEYLAGLHIVDRCGGNKEAWREFLTRASTAFGGTDKIKGFLLAVRDCCLASDPDLKVPSNVADELAKQTDVDLDVDAKALLEERVRELTLRLSAHDSEDRLFAAKALADIGPTARAAVPALIKALNDESTYVCAAAAKALGRIGEKSTAALLALIGALNEKHVVTEAATAISALMGHPVGWGWAAPRVKLPSIQKEPTQRFAGGWGDSVVVSSLTQVFNDDRSSCEVRKTAVHVLGKIAPVQKAVPLLISMLQDGSPDVARSAAEALGELGLEAKTAVPALVEAAERDDLRLTVQEALHKIEGGTDARAAIPNK